eukprot:gene7163-7735_t
MLMFLLLVVLLTFEQGIAFVKRADILAKKPIPLSIVTLKQDLSLKALASPPDYWSVWSLVALSSYTGLKLEENTKIGKSLSSPVCAMLFSALLTNINLLPEGSVHITTLQSFIVKYATPLLLLGADVRKILRESGGLLKSFLIGTLGTALGSLTSFCIFQPWFQALGLLSDGWKMVSAITAKNIGGGINFMAVSSILQLSSHSISLALTVDNIMGLFYFPFISFLGTRYNQTKRLNSDSTSSTPASTNTKTEVEVSSLLSAITIGLIIVAISEKIAKQFTVSSLLVSTILSILIASTIFSSNSTTFDSPQQQQIEKNRNDIIYSAELIGKLLLLLFFGSIGNSVGNITQLITSPTIIPLLLFVFSLYSFHLLILFFIGKKLLNLNTSDLLLGSNANIGNAATACTLATSMGWKEKLIPAILVGNLGNILGSFIGIWLGVYFLKPLSKS